MLTSKQRADLRAQANDLDTTLMVGKGGVTENVLSEAARQLEARELVKGRVLEAALLSAREVCDALCEALGADGVQCVGSKFVIYRRSEKKAQEAARQARELKKRNASRIFAYATYAIFTNGLDEFDRAYEEGLLSGVFGTNLTYRSPELLSREWFHEVDVSKYIAYFIAAINHDMSVSAIIGSP